MSEITAPVVAPDDEVITTIDQELQQTRAQLAALRIVQLYERHQVLSSKSRVNGRIVTKSVADFVYPANSPVPRHQRLVQAIEAAEARRFILETAKAEYDEQYEAWKAYHFNEVAPAVEQAIEQLEADIAAARESSES